VHAIGWYPMARPRVRRVRTLPRGPREPVPAGAYTGYQIDGGYAEFAAADASVRVPLRDSYDGPSRGAAHVCRLDRLSRVSHGRNVPSEWASTGSARRRTSSRKWPCTRHGTSLPSSALVETSARRFALDVGACWAGWSTDAPPSPLDAAIIFAPVGSRVPEALTRTGARRNRHVCRSAHSHERHPVFSVQDSGGGRVVRIGRQRAPEDARSSWPLAAHVAYSYAVRSYALTNANLALEDLRADD
jgi:propanol-preferring alcohol dehydrogenase